jgi:hypothetical protein
MLENLLRFAKEDNANIAVDWVVLVAGAVSLALAISLTVINSNAETGAQANVDITANSAVF